MSTIRYEHLMTQLAEVEAERRRAEDKLAEVEARSGRQAQNVESLFWRARRAEKRAERAEQELKEEKQRTILLRKNCETHEEDLERIDGERARAEAALRKIERNCTNIYALTIARDVLPPEPGGYGKHLSAENAKDKSPITAHTSEPGVGIDAGSRGDGQGSLEQSARVSSSLAPRASVDSSTEIDEPDENGVTALDRAVVEDMTVAEPETDAPSQTCKRCGGSGEHVASQFGPNFVPCPACDGTGIGSDAPEFACPACGGSGQAKNPCPICREREKEDNGTGLIEERGSGMEGEKP